MHPQLDFDRMKITRPKQSIYADNAASLKYQSKDDVREEEVGYRDAALRILIWFVVEAMIERRICQTIVWYIYICEINQKYLSTHPNISQY